MPDLKPLINYIIDQVNQQGGNIGRTALTKLVYLVDVEHSRQYGKPATNLQWQFHHYGPYAAELQSEIQSIGLYADEAQFTGKSGRRPVSGYRYRPTGDWREIQGAFNANYGASVKRCIEKVVGQWGLEPLPTILDYVYFETEPMQDVKRGDLLDFSKIQIQKAAPHNAAKLEFDQEFINDLRRKWKEKREAAAKKKPRKMTEPVYDEVYYEALKMMAEEETAKFHFPPNTKVLGPDQE